MRIRIKSGECPNYLTVGKVYEVIPEDCNVIRIINDAGGAISIIRTIDCGHLNGGSWELVDED